MNYSTITKEDQSLFMILVIFSLKCTVYYWSNHFTPPCIGRGTRQHRAPTVSYRAVPWPRPAPGRWSAAGDRECLSLPLSASALSCKWQPVGSGGQLFKL